METQSIPQIDNDVYNRLADTWWDETGPLYILKAAINPWRVPYFRRVLAQLQIDPHDKRILDVGCGGGVLAEEFAAMGFTVTGIDPSDKSLDAARAHAAANSLSIDYRLGYGDALPFEDESFDVVYCCDVLEHIHGWDAVIGEMARVLRRHGVMFFDTVNRTAYSKVFVINLAQAWSYTRFFPPNVHVWEMFIKPVELKMSLARHGLRCEDIRGMKLVTNPIQMLKTIRQYKTGKISATEFGKRIGFQEGSNVRGSYMGYAVKEQ